jgi:LCP family protein required for cell wall assembly
MPNKRDMPNSQPRTDMQPDNAWTYGPTGLPIEQISVHSHPTLVMAPVAVTRRRRRWRRLLLMSLAVLLTLIAALACTAAVLFEDPAALQAASARFLPPQPGAVAWDGSSRVVVAFFGLTQRTTEPARTDTILILTLDPRRHQASLLSVPRDLWVDIPGYGYGKLAIAYEVGGPRLATYTLQRDLGIPVQYYVALTFRGFSQLVDALGGVTIDVPQELQDPTYPCLTTTAYCPIDIKPGTQHMDGAHALEFVRERHAFAQQDLTRVRDQQAFLTALRHQVLSLGTLFRLPTLIPVVRQDLITDLPYNALPSLGLAYARVPASAVTHAYIDLASGLVQNGWSADGQAILLPSTATGIPRLVGQVTHDPLPGQVNAAVTVWNGSGSAGLASEVGTALQGEGLSIAAVGDAPQTGRQQTIVVRNTLVASPDADTVAHLLAQLLEAPVVSRPEPDARTPLVVLLGSDMPGAH